MVVHRRCREVQVQRFKGAEVVQRWCMGGIGTVVQRGAGGEEERCRMVQRGAEVQRCRDAEVQRCRSRSRSRSRCRCRCRC
jgi:hypothetical protein